LFTVILFIKRLEDTSLQLGSRFPFFIRPALISLIRSFSKAFMPGIRMGAAVLPQAMIEEILDLKHISDLNTSKIPQAALDAFIKSGMYEKHIKKVKKSYESKLKKAAEIFRALSPKDLNYHVPDHGIFIWIELPDHIEAVEFEKRLEDKGILVRAGLDFFPKQWSQQNNTTYCNYIRLCISGVPEEHIESLITVISVITGWRGISNKWHKMSTKLWK